MALSGSECFFVNRALYTYHRTPSGKSSNRARVVRSSIMILDKAVASGLLTEAELATAQNSLLRLHDVAVYELAAAAVSERRRHARPRAAVLAVGVRNRLASRLRLRLLVLALAGPIHRPRWTAEVRRRRLRRR
jgi:hypothetical protein